MNRSSNLINQVRIRQIPRHFSWLDHRLIHENYLQKVSCAGCSLYLFLTCVGDELGLSYYSEQAIKTRLHHLDVKSARAELLECGLIAYNKPFYQVLSLPAKQQNLEQGTNPDALRSWLKEL